MTNDKAPDNATGDSVTNAELITRAHAFMAALLTFLGFNVLPTETAFDMLDTLTQWLADAKKIRRDPQGATARIWWDAFKEAWKDSYSKDSYSSEAAESADAAVAEFGKRFLPVADEHDRDTFDTADFEALRTECDRLDANIAILESRADDLQQNLNAIVAERDALLKVTAHHASEVELLRQERDNIREIRSANLLEMASVANALDAVRAVIGQKNLPDADVGAAVALAVAERDTWKSDALSCHMVLAKIRDDFALTPSWESAPWSELPIRIRARRLEHVEALEKEIDELKAQLASAIVPLPKPERVEPGQRWALMIDVGDPLGTIAAPRRGWYIGNGVTRFCIELPYDMSFAQSSMVYLGKEGA